MIRRPIAGSQCGTIDEPRMVLVHFLKLAVFFVGNHTV